MNRKEYSEAMAEAIVDKGPWKGKTGKTCERSGIYQAVCIHQTEISLSKDDQFPPCQKGDHGVEWFLIRATKQ